MLSPSDIALLSRAGQSSPRGKPLAEWDRIDWSNLVRESVEWMVLHGVDEPTQIRRSEVLVSSIGGMFPTDSRWQDMPIGEARYHAYLRSPQWRQRVDLVRGRSGGVCERCGVGCHEHTHHLTYDRLYHEPLSDLQGVCRECHETLHGIGTIDPLKLDPLDAAEQLRVLKTLRLDAEFRRRFREALRV